MTATVRAQGYSRFTGAVQPLDDLDLDEEAACFTRQTSPNCRLVACSAPSPTCADAPDDTRLEFNEFQLRARRLAKEFFCSLDVEGMVASLQNLGCQAFHDELTALLLRASLDQKEAARQAVVPLLSALADAQLLSVEQLSRGFEKLVLAWSDLQLDVPDAPGLLVSLLSSRVGLLDRGLFQRLPEELLRSLCQKLPTCAVSNALEKHVIELSNFKADLHNHIERDLFRTCRADGLAEWLKRECKPAFHHEAVLCALLSTFDGKPSSDAAWTSYFDAKTLQEERGRVVLDSLVQLCGDDVLCDVDVQLGFSRLLGHVTGEMTCKDDDSLKHLVKLLQGAVEKELLPAQFLKMARRLRYGGSWGVVALRQAQRQTPLHSRRVWGSGDVRQMRAEMHDTIQEFFDSRSIEEVAQVVEELHLSSKEQVIFLRKLFVEGMERGEPGTVLDLVHDLLDYCWSEYEVQGAFQDLRDVSKDLVLDFPQCRERTNELLAAAVARGILNKSYLEVDATTVV
mmetsp:Transcript_89931/g.160037  ORF Transcript_89931/g.160037 Transcript_89931/m.160037 type:complete len:512 (+) Transcript_89931:77-1612(+)|eukprot:CAMPEP_0197626012 /NCGR_PEP_ID=MMETSP1338-20131121/5182_1 /TAXON_ID=43686 ORGANISM="Pelagodinium beii, Strain RCC1491" /NCGR_SAMPLE_ID=MMETSP1338 /ASSEMBLY_ACC=CAM_ASM_000754 /LENGTH=511 /DNA_ID=CAMNT_0043196529 /DNA_START=67 /DNA_END=1602 /DNA_ORIENTATION=-